MPCCLSSLPPFFVFLSCHSCVSVVTTLFALFSLLSLVSFLSSCPSFVTRFFPFSVFPFALVMLVHLLYHYNFSPPPPPPLFSLSSLSIPFVNTACLAALLRRGLGAALKAISIYNETGRFQQAGKMLQEVGDIHESEGEMEAAVDALQQAAEYLAVRKRPFFFFFDHLFVMLMSYCIMLYSGNLCTPNIQTGGKVGIQIDGSTRPVSIRWSTNKKERSYGENTRRSYAGR